jgi:hypothetical protein
MEEFVNKPMLVMQVRPEFSVAYKASPKLKFRKEHLETKKDLQSFLSKTAKNWKEGEYFLRSGKGTFAAFFVKKGGKITLHKENKNKVPYLVWNVLGIKK